MSKEIFYADTRMGTLRHADPDFNFRKWFGDIILARTLADFYEYEADCSRNQYEQMLRELEDEVTPYIDINDIEDYDESRDYTWDKEAREMPRNEWFELCEEELLKSQSTRDGRSYASASFEELTNAEKFRDSVEWTVLCTLGSTYGKDVRNKYVRYKKLKEQYEDLKLRDLHVEHHYMNFKKLEERNKKMRNEIKQKLDEKGDEGEAIWEANPDGHYKEDQLRGWCEALEFVLSLMKAQEEEE